MISIFTNTNSNTLAKTQEMLKNTMHRLSTGLRINSAKDDASGIAIASRMDANLRGYSVALRNAADGISVSQSAEAGLAQTGDMLQRMRELAVQSANATLATGDRDNLEEEFKTLQREVARVVSTTEFNGKALLNTGSTLDIQVGTTSGTTQTISISTTDMSVSLATAMSGAASINSISNSLAALSAIDLAINSVTTARAKMGALQTRFESAINILRANQVALQDAENRITNADFATETANLTRLQVQQQAGVTMLAQANQTPQTVLSLLGR